MWLAEDLYSKCLKYLSESYLCDVKWVSLELLSTKVWPGSCLLDFRSNSDWLKQLEIGSLYTRASKRQKSLVEKWSMPKNWQSTRIIGRNVGIAPKMTKKNGRWRHLNLTILELYLTTQRARKVDVAAILDSNNAQNARKITCYVAKYS